MNSNMFEYATRNKLRFDSTRGPLNVEMLWDVPLRSKDGFDLDAVAKAANRSLKAHTEESFVNTSKTADIEHAETALEIVKRVIAVKIAEEESAKRRAANRAEKARLLQALAEKQAGTLTALTEKQLQDRIDTIDT